MSGTTIIVTSGIIRNHENKVLLVKRAPHDSFPNKWQFPGGKAEYGEHPEESLKREILEETGLAITPLFPIVINQFKSSTKDIQYVEIFYLVDLATPSQIVVLSPEHSDFSWIDIEEVINFDTTEYIESVVAKAKASLILSPK